MLKSLQAHKNRPLVEYREQISMAIFIAKGKIYVVPSFDIRNYRHAVFVRLNEQEMPDRPLVVA
jgi:hypothetical protein